MKRNRMIPGILAGMLMVTTVASPVSAGAVEKGRALDDGLVGYYTFDDSTLENSQNADNNASAIVTGLGKYNEEVAYEDNGKSGKAVQLGEYGLKLNQENLGDNFTVSLWMKPDGLLADNQSVMFLGYHNPEKWLSVAGAAGWQAPPSTKCKLWANGNGYSWNEISNLNMDSSDWHCLTLTGTEKTMACYLDGKKVGEGKTNTPLTGNNQDIYVGVNNWDVEFTGLVDEIKVYNRTLSDGEIYQLYDSEATAEDILKAEGIRATETLKIVKGRTAATSVELPSVVEEADYEIAYASDNEEVATVDVKGNVTAVASGTATVTTSVTLGSTTVTAETEVTVTDSLESELKASYDFEGKIENAVENGSTAKAIVTGLKSYTGTVEYADGRNGKAVKLGDYGLQLNEKNLGEEYTVSFWLKPDGALATNQCVYFMGYHNPEKWIAVSGASGSSECKFWARGGIYSTWTTLASPVIGSEDWHQLTLTGTKGKVTAYLDGISLGTKDSNDPLKGANQDIYLGVNNWDAEFTGLMDDVKIYSIAMTEEEVQAQAQEEFEKKLAAKLEAGLDVKNLLGKNDSADNIRYDLVIPEEVQGMKVEWTSSNEDVIAADGSVANQDKETEVTLKVKVAEGALTAERTFTFKVAAIDKTELLALIEKAEAVDRTYLTEASKGRLDEAIANAKAAKNYGEVEEASANLDRACTELYYVEEYMNPFAEIKDPVVEKELKAGEEAQLFEIPDSVKDAVEVTYESEDTAVATYEGGKVTAVAEGKTVVTAVVTSKFDNFTMEYSTAISVAEDDTEEPVEPEQPTDPEKPVDPEQPTDPEKPVDPEEPTDPEKPVEPEQPTDPEEPTAPEKPQKPSEGTNGDGNVQTGDTAQVLPMAAMLLAAVVVMVLVNRKRSMR